MRALVLLGDPAAKLLPPGVEIVEGNVCDASAADLFSGELPGEKTVVIHAAGIVSIASREDPRVRAVILGPYDPGHGHLTQLVIDYCRGGLTACVRGGYDFCDVRDVAHGILSCCQSGRSGECYILSGRYCEIPELLEELHEITGRKAVKTILPRWFAGAAAPLAEAYYRLRRQPPLYTRYSLATLHSNAAFSHEKADHELGYRVTPLRVTLQDTVRWLGEQGRI